MKCPYIVYHIPSTKTISSSSICFVPVLFKLSWMLPLFSCDMIIYFQSLEDFLTTLQSPFFVMRSKLNRSYLKHCLGRTLITLLPHQVPSTDKKLLLLIQERFFFLIILIFFPSMSRHLLHCPGVVLLQHCFKLFSKSQRKMPEILFTIFSSEICFRTIKS